MATRQTRRTVSFKSEVFERARRHCAGAVPLAAWMERVVRAALDAEGAPAVSREEAVQTLRENADIVRAEREREVEAAMARAFG